VAVRSEPARYDAINYAFHDDGRVAIATGGGHAVAVFDAGGHFLGRTKPDLYKFTNGFMVVWRHAMDDRHESARVVELDGNTLAEKSRVQLSQHCGVSNTSAWPLYRMARHPGY